MDDADAAAFKRKQHCGDCDSFSGTFPLRMELQRVYDSVELCDLERLDLGCVAADYEKLLPRLKDFFLPGDQNHRRQGCGSVRTDRRS